MRHRPSLAGGIDVRQQGSYIGPVGVTAVFDAKGDDLTFVVVDAVQHAVCAAACGPDSREIVPKRLPHALRVIDRRRERLTQPMPSPLRSPCATLLN